MGETVKHQYVVKEKVPKINFTPTTEEERKHLLEMKELLNLKRRGDWDLVAKMLKIPRQSAEKAFLRVYSKNHFEAVKALDEIIENRIKLLNQ